MDLALRCNSLKCRAQLNDRAVVTTCSHIFCIRCSDGLGLSNSAGGTKTCPACDTQLPNPDDVAVANLNPPEDYKTSVLSGLSPGIIMECAGRGIAFYTYQMTQEVIYQEYLAKSLTEKYGTLSTQLDKIIHEANSEIMGLRDKLSSVHAEKTDLEQKNHELVEAYREKSRNQQQIQKLYQTLKAQVMTSHVATAASDDAEYTLQSATGNRFSDRLGSRRMAQPGASHFPGNIHGVGQGTGHHRSAGSDRENARFLGRNSGMMGNDSAGSRVYSQPRDNFIGTPQHRTRLPVPADRGAGFYGGESVGQGQPASRIRQPLGNLSANSFAQPGPGGYGLSAGMRIGKQAVRHDPRGVPGASKLSNSMLP